MEPVTLTLLALGGYALISGGKKKSSTRVVTHSSYGVKGPEDRLYYLNEIRSMSQWVSERYGMMPFLADYLSAKGYWESRFNPAATNAEVTRNPTNAARGLFGMRPKTAYKGEFEYMRAYPNSLLNPRWSFVAAVSHIAGAAAAVERKGSGIPDWVSASRWWALPKLVHDFSEDSSKSTAVRERLETAVYKCNRDYGTNMDPDFIWRPIEANNFPGMPTLVKDFGLQGVT